jgi:hypothetical protein
MMVKPATVNRIRQLSKRGKSSNEIVRQLRREGIGIRRQTILGYAREFKGRQPKAQPYKYIPRKYLTRERRIHIEHEVKQKHIAIYGKVNGISKRIEVSGTGKQLYSILFDAVEHPPKKRFLRTPANKLMTIHGRGEYLDMREEWDEKPTVTS